MLGLEVTNSLLQLLRHGGDGEVVSPSVDSARAIRSAASEAFETGTPKTSRSLPLRGTLRLTEFFSTHTRSFAKPPAPINKTRRSLEAIFDSCGLWRWDRATDQIWTTTCCRKLLGLGEQIETPRNDFLKAFHHDDWSGILSELDRSALEGLPLDVAYRVVRQDGDVRWLSVKGSPEHGPTGDCVGIAGVIVDVTVWKSAQVEYERQRQQLTRLTRIAILGEMSGALAHELNQPLTAILSNAQAAQQLLMQQPIDLAEIKEILGDIVASDRRAGEVIRGVRTLLKPGETQRQSLDIRELVIEAIELIHSELVTHQVMLTTDLASDLPRCRGNRIQLQQVVLNLVLNACKEMLKVPVSARALRISATHGSDGTIEIAVSDSGPGISDDIANKLFESFVTTTGDGLGLGLSISKAIVSAHGGRIEVAKTGTEGATFVVSLPPDSESAL